MPTRVQFILVIALGVGAALVLRWQFSPKEDPSSSSTPSIAATSRPSQPEPTDYTQHPVIAPEEADRGPARIISLAPSITETLCALGLKDRLVGRTQYCLHPPSVIEQAPAVGALMDTNLERITMLEPDLVLATANSRQVIDRLNRLGITCEPVPHETLEDVFLAIDRVGELCHRPESAALLNRRIRADMDAQCEAAKAMKLPSRNVLVTTGPLPVPPRSLWVAGPGSFFEELLHLTGHSNAAKGLETSFTEMSLVTLMQTNPEVILEFREVDDPLTRDELYREWSRFDSLDAIRNRRVRTVGELEWLSAGPRVAIALDRLITTLSDVEVAR